MQDDRPMQGDGDDWLAGWFGDDAPAGDAPAGRDTGPDAPHGAGSDRAPQSRRPVVVVGLAAAVLWTAAAVLGVTGDPGAAAPAPSTTPPGPVPSPVATGSGPQGTVAVPTPGARDASVPATTTAATGDAGTVRRAGALAVVALHDLASSSADGGTARWIDAAAVEDVELLELDGPAGDVGGPPGGGADARSVAVVTLRAVVLEGDDDGWTTRRRARYAIPVACGAHGCKEAADPWPLAVDADAPTAAPGRAGGPDDPVEAALAAAGYADITVNDTARLWQDVLEVRAEAVAPGEQRPATHVLWALAPGPAAAPTAPASPTAPAAPEPRVLGGGPPD